MGDTDNNEQIHRQKRNEEIQHTQAMILKLRTSLKKKILSDNFIFRDDKFNSYNFNVPLCNGENTCY